MERPKLSHLERMTLVMEAATKLVVEGWATHAAAREANKIFDLTEGEVVESYEIEEHGERSTENEDDEETGIREITSNEFQKLTGLTDEQLRRL